MRVLQVKPVPEATSKKREASVAPEAFKKSKKEKKAKH